MADCNCPLSLGPDCPHCAGKAEAAQFRPTVAQAIKRTHQKFGLAFKLWAAEDALDSKQKELQASQAENTALRAKLEKVEAFIAETRRKALSLDDPAVRVSEIEAILEGGSNVLG